MPLLLWGGHNKKTDRELVLVREIFGVWSPPWSTLAAGSGVYPAACAPLCPHYLLNYWLPVPGGWPTRTPKSGYWHPGTRPLLSQNVWVARVSSRPEDSLWPALDNKCVHVSGLLPYWVMHSVFLLGQVRETLWSMGTIFANVTCMHPHPRGPTPPHPFSLRTKPCMFVACSMQTEIPKT